VVVAKEKADTVMQKLKNAGEQVHRIGVIEAQQDRGAEPMVSMRNCDTAWN
jgi:phosphoribosylaminoimidazole (AIR) synthetase